MLISPKRLRSGWYKLNSVVDGDTITVIVNDKKEYVRFIGVDAPELNIRKKAPPEKGAKKATNILKKKLKGSEYVYLSFDKDKRDKYGRLLAYVYIRKYTFLYSDIGLYLIRSGVIKRLMWLGNNKRLKAKYEAAFKRKKKKSKKSIKQWIIDLLLDNYD